MLQLAAVFSDHMVLQREKNIVVFGIGEVGAPFAEGFGIEHVVAHHRYVDTNRSCVIILAQSVADKGVGILYTVYEV